MKVQNIVVVIVCTFFVSNIWLVFSFTFNNCYLHNDAFSIFFRFIYFIFNIFRIYSQSREKVIRLHFSINFFHAKCTISTTGQNLLFIKFGSNQLCRNLSSGSWDQKIISPIQRPFNVAPQNYELISEPRAPVGQKSSELKIYFTQ